MKEALEELKKKLDTCRMSKWLSLILGELYIRVPELPGHIYSIQDIL